MSVLIGHASKDERGRASGGKSGDQTGGEVCIRSWYNANWDRLLRAKSPVVAEKMARFVEEVCKSNKVGYDQGQRNTLRDYAKAAYYDISKLKDNCETDCSAFMTVAAEAAGISVKYMGGWNAPVTQTMVQVFRDTGAFDVFSDSKYLTGTDYLKRGDILVRQSGHTAMVLSDGNLAKASQEPRKNLDKTVDDLAREVLAGKWSVWPERERLLKAAGYDAAAVQKRVNEILRGG